jgi:tetratricopeptide (TPR) repeat protein
MRRARAACVALCLVFAVSPLAAETAEERGDRFYRDRAAGFVATGELDPEPIAAAIAAYEEALEQQPESFGLYFKLMDALYFQGFYVVGEKRLQRPIFDHLLELSDRTLELLAAKAGKGDALASLPPDKQAEVLRQVPEAAEVHFWAAAAWGLWGMSHSVWSALRAGVIHQVADHAALVVRLDDRCHDAGGLRVLGRMHAKTPKVPFVTGWIDRQEGLALLRRALAISRRDPRTLLFLAEAILDYEKESRAEAVELLRELDGRSPDPAELYEETEVLREARELLAEVEGGHPARD